MPGFALLPYWNGAVGVNAVNTQLNAVTDPDFVQDGASRFRLLEDYQLIAVGLIGASVTKGRFQIPHWNALAEFDIFAANRNAGPPATPWYDFYDRRPLPIPKLEGVEIDVSGNLGAATEADSAFILVRAADGMWPEPPIGIPFKTIATFTVTPTVGAWSAPQAITFTQTLRGGVYAVLGCVLQGGNSDYFRIIFPRYRMYAGRKLRPGLPLQGAIGSNPSFQLQSRQLLQGEWGRFRSDELPQFEVLGRTASSTTYTAFLDLLYLGDDLSLVTQGSGGGSMTSVPSLMAAG